MINLVAVKALAGYNYVRIDQVIAISAQDPTKCTIVMAGGYAINCAEPAKDVLEKFTLAAKERKD